MDQYTPVFAIAAAAELAEMHPQTLRQYDRIGLVSPQRTRGNTRRYSLHDVSQLRQVARLSAEGLSLEGIRRVLALQDRVEQLEGRVLELERALAAEMLKRPDRRVFAAGSAGEVVSLRRGTRTQRRAEVVVWRPGRHSGNGS
ncbi:MULTISPECIES: heat shock protein transcriptional repressor HspR [unclassified Leucobacter]|uniref:heat shock protein transcriptional repressor HspR n=1 Tax=unclassified Leucobacter TaxID=2621730 RepID=UPI00165D8E18|nr:MULTISPECIES: MerR family transcriptional regulator [unclassified Leucobacter]MBC9927071.1 MerR family transcriptional regulator [Leucobacter sp. cx-169]MBC9936352.1 MerR family transcriptional regulator [Leucobacter sp. cx-87]